MLRRLALFVFLIALTQLGCRKGAAVHEPSTLLLPIGTFAPPQPNQTLTGDVIIGGWAIHESGIKSVSIFIDRDFLMSANVGLDRPDVAKAYPAFRANMISGWNALLAAGSIPPGPHELVARIQAVDGSHRDLSVPVVFAP